MANTLTGLGPVLYEALDVVSRENVGFIHASTINAEASKAAVGQTVRSPVAPASTAVDNTPGSYAPDTGGQVIAYKDIVITKSRNVPVQWTGEEQMYVGGLLNPILVDQFAQAMRTLTGEIDNDLYVEAYKKSSRAVGTAGNAPFATANDLSDFAAVLRVMEENGVPMSDLHLVAGSAAFANLRGKQSVLFKMNEAGTDELLRRGIVGEVMGLNLHNSQKIGVHTKGTGTGYVTNLLAPLAVGATSIDVDTGSNTVIAGDIVTFTGDANKYIVGSALSAGTLGINAPGLRGTLADGVDMTVGNSYTPNVALRKSALQLAVRAPYVPAGGDAATDRMFITDPVSGITFEIAEYKTYRQVHFEVAVAWGVSAVKSEHIVTLMG